MKIFTTTHFTGCWPVPCAAVVAARDAECAAAILNDKLKASGLPGDASAALMKEFPIPAYENQTAVEILSDGNY